MADGLMELYRDSDNDFTIAVVNNDNEAQDISLFVVRFEFYQDGTTVTLSLGNGITFQNDGSDGVIVVVVTKSQVNKFCPGIGRLRCFNDAEGRSILFSEGTFTVEGKSYDA